jgi:hypothetical protein
MGSSQKTAVIRGKEARIVAKDDEMRTASPEHSVSPHGLDRTAGAGFIPS